jgi:cell cycle checkpoint protein MEC1
MGDRHCDNILMCEDGEIFHIDYECIFNKAKGLPVPEIVDFRLTKNFRHGLGTLLE